MNATLLGKVDLQTLETSNLKNEEMSRIINLLQNFDLAEIEKNISEDLNKEIMLRDNKNEDNAYIEFDKYSFLAYLKEMFETYREEGNTSLTIYEGTCGDKACEFGGSKSYCFEGNVDKKCFAFVVSFQNGDFLNEENQIKTAKACPNFIDKDGNMPDMNYDYYWKSLIVMTKFVSWKAKLRNEANNTQN